MNDLENELPVAPPDLSEQKLEKPLLGLATNKQLLDELRTRIELDYYQGGMGLGYSSVGGRSYGLEETK